MAKREKNPRHRLTLCNTDVIVGGAQPLGQRHRVSRLLSIMHVNTWRSFSIQLVTFPQQTHHTAGTTEAVVWPKDQRACKMKLCVSGYFLASSCRRCCRCCLTLQQLSKAVLVTSAATWTQKWKYNHNSVRRPQHWTFSCFFLLLLFSPCEIVEKATCKSFIKIAFHMIINSGLVSHFFFEELCERVWRQGVLAWVRVNWASGRCHKKWNLRPSPRLPWTISKITFVQFQFENSDLIPFDHLVLV